MSPTVARPSTVTDKSLASSDARRNVKRIFILRSFLSSASALACQALSWVVK
jgi:hypothetical protein